jgi:hypothetical protein
MMLPIDEIVVKDIAGDEARVYVTNSAHKSDLIGIGFNGKNNDLAKPLHCVEDRIRAVLRLIELGALFSDGRDWSPAEVVEYYREQGFISGPYRVIAWKNLKQCVMSTR